MHWIINVFVSLVVFVQSIVGGGGQTVTPVVTSNISVATTTDTEIGIGGVGDGKVNVKVNTKIVQDGVESTSTDSDSNTVIPDTSLVPPTINIQIPSISIEKPVIQSKPMADDGTQVLLPAYTEDELRDVFLARLPAWAKTGRQSVPEGVWPVVVSVTSSTTANISYVSHYVNWGDVVFEGAVILHVDQSDPKDSNTNNVRQKELEGLTPNTVYNYQLVWKEEGRADTVISQSFKTLAQ